MVPTYYQNIAGSVALRLVWFGGRGNQQLLDFHEPRLLIPLEVPVFITDF